VPPNVKGLGMNLRRGLFRLWIVGSALFVLAVAFVSYDPIKREFEGEVVRNPYAPSTLAPSSNTNIIQFEGQLYGFLADATDEQIATALKNVRAPSPWASVGTAAGIAFGIPLAVLALGASLLWALSGFAAERQSGR
jgi:hypothetical protein